MHPLGAHNRWLIWLSFGGAMALRILPLPEALEHLSPDWLLLALLYWCLALPEVVGIGTAWLVGLLADALTGTLLGQHAFAYALVTWLCMNRYQRLRLDPPAQQALVILVYLFLAHGFRLWLLAAQTAAALTPAQWLAVPVGALLWPFVARLLRHLRRIFRVR